MKPRQAAVDALEEWVISEKVSALSFDTTATNAGRQNGTCVLLKQKLCKDVLYLACRHYVMEFP